MATNKKPRKAYVPKHITSGMHLVAGKQPIGEADTQRIMAPFSANLYEAAMGHGYGPQIKVITLFISAAHDAGLYYKSEALRIAADRAGDAWIQAGDMSISKGITDRTVFNANQLEQVRVLLRGLYDLMPQMEVGAWMSFVENAARRWNKYAKKSVFGHATEQLAA